jgi:hypothetical protein
MRIPFSDQAIVDDAKVRDYLLSPEHPVGRFKAAFFRSVGFTRDHWELLRDQLLLHAQLAVAALGQPSQFGQKYEVRATVVGPGGARAEVVTVWIVLDDEEVPRLVTAFPAEVG